MAGSRGSEPVFLFNFFLDTDFFWSYIITVPKAKENVMYQKLLTAEIKAKLPKIGSMDGKDPTTVPIVVKFFSPYNGWTWYATEGEPVKNDSGIKALASGVVSL